MNTLCGNDFLTGPFDNCLGCHFLGDGCSGPRTTCMPHERYVEWLKALKRLRNCTNQDIADGTGLSKATIDDFFAGRRKSISRETAGLLENFLIGEGKWPCAMKLVTDKEVIYEDRPETLEALRLRTEQFEHLRQDHTKLQDTVDRELERVHKNHEDEVTFYRSIIDHLKEQVLHKDGQLARKDQYIDILTEIARNGGDLTKLGDHLR